MWLVAWVSTFSRWWLWKVSYWKFRKVHTPIQFPQENQNLTGVRTQNDWGANAVVPQVCWGGVACILRMEQQGTPICFSIYFTSVQSIISDRQPRKTSCTLVTFSLPQSANAAECGLFSWAAVCTDALNWNKIDWKTNWYALAPPAVSYHASKLALPPTLYWNPTNPNHKVETATLRWKGPTQTWNSNLILGLQFNTALTCHSVASSQLHSLAWLTSSDDMPNTVTAYSIKQNLTFILPHDSSSAPWI